MPKARVETWQTCAAPQTPLQRSAFLDLCTHWLVREPAEEAADAGRLTPRTTWEAGETAAVASGLGATRDELRAQCRRACALCGRADGRHAPVVANPFAQCPLALVCAACRG